VSVNESARLTSSQGHSGANHQNKVHDSRNDELFITIKEIDRLQPDIFILENVLGMKRDRDGGDESEGAKNFAVAGIRGLREIGYQVRLVQLDSRSFGSPQNRNRLFLICARRGVPLPSTPEPTHANPELEVNRFASGSKSFKDFYVGSQGDYGSGPFPAVTVRDAISDLPRFEYNHRGYAAPRGMPTFDANRATGDRIGFLEPRPYDSPACNDYQARQRKEAMEVENHYTPPWTPRILDMYVTFAVQRLD